MSSVSVANIGVGKCVVALLRFLRFRFGQGPAPWLRLNPAVRWKYSFGHGTYFVSLLQFSFSHAAHRII
jgi:hypothetical protein